MQNSTNMRILELLRFLYERTDENHPATVSDIIAHLNGKGIQAVRQTVYADTNALIDAGIDIVVVKSTQNQYFMGSRLFEYPELKMLTDAVASSKIISAKKSEELVQKLCRLTSLHQAKQLQKFAALSSRVKPHNEKVYYIIDNIQTAIGNHQQIRFQYYEYTQEKKKILKHDGYYYVVNPYALEWKNDHYYLIGFSLKHQKIAHFRVDRLTSVENLETYFMPIEGFDVASYTNKMVDMFTSESSKEVTLLCENELMRVIIDHYGEDVPVEKYAARRRSRIGTMVWRAGWCGSDPELSENVRAGLKAKDRSRHAQTGKPLYKTPYRQVRCGSLRTLLVSINTS